MSTELLITSVLLGVGLAMDAFSVSVANGLADSGMNKGRMFSIAGTFAGFQFLMPMIGWLLVTEAARVFKWFSPLIPWIALVLLLIIGGGLLKDGIEELRDSKTGTAEADKLSDTAKLGFWALMMQGVATSIDALSVGFTISDFEFPFAFAESLIIGIVTFLICLAGIFLGRKAASRFAEKAPIIGGIILIAIGIEIFLKGIL